MNAVQTGADAEAANDLLDVYSDITRRWVERSAAEVNLLAALGTDLTGARSLPDAMHAYRNLMTERMDLLAEDGRRAVEDCGRLAAAAMRLFGDRLSTHRTVVLR